MVRDIKVYLGTVLRIANAEILPFDWRRWRRSHRDDR